MDNQQIREVLESVMKDKKEHPPVKLISQEKLDQLINSYYKTQPTTEKKS